MIDVEGLTFTYRRGAEPAVRDVSLRVPEGQVIGLLGPSGSGKTTIQKVLTKLLPLQEGRVSYDGRPVTALGRDLFASVGVSFEHPNLFGKLTGLENLMAYAGLYPGPLRDPAELLTAVGLGDAMGKRADAYSKGMKQRLVFARALLHRPRFLFLDEPTSGLDPALGERVRQLIAEERGRGAAVLLTTHDMALADQLCDRLALLHRGTIVADDTPRALKLAHGEHAVRIERRHGASLEEEVLFLDRPADRERLPSVLLDGEIETVHSQEATLADVFIQLTGQTLR